MNRVGTVPGNLPKVSSTYCACSEISALKRSSWTCALPRKPGLSVHAPGVPVLNGPPGPNLRATNASTAAAMSAWCGGQKASKTPLRPVGLDRKSTRLNSSHANISYAVFCLKKKIIKQEKTSHHI